MHQTHVIRPRASAFFCHSSQPASRSWLTGSAKSMCMVVPPASAAAWPLRMGGAGKAFKQPTLGNPHVKRTSQGSVNLEWRQLAHQQPTFPPTPSNHTSKQRPYAKKSSQATLWIAAAAPHPSTTATRTIKAIRRSREEVVAGDLAHEGHGQVGVRVDAARHHQLACRAGRQQQYRRQFASRLPQPNRI